MKTLDERTILLQIKNGDLQNFEILYEKYYNKVFFLILKMIGNKNLVEDISQEVFIDAIYGLKNLKNLDTFNAWLTKIAINKANLNIKKLITRKKKILNENYSKFINIISNNITIEESLIKKESSDNFLKIINKLSKKKRKTIILYYYNEFSLKEISDIENLSIGTVKSRLYSAISDLKKLIKSNTPNLITI